MTQRVHVLLVADSDKEAPLLVRELLDAGLDVVVERVDDSEALEHAVNKTRLDAILAARRHRETRDRWLPGEVRLEIEDQDLVALAEAAVDELAGRLERLDSTVVWDLPRVPLFGRWDGDRVKLAIRSLLENAMKFAPGGPIEISVRAARSWARLGVKDEGPGLTPEDRAKLFDRDRRPACLSNGGGFGLGLWIVRRVAEEHRGHVAVWSEPGAGAELALLLPRNLGVDASHHESAVE